MINHDLSFPLQRKFVTLPASGSRWRRWPLERSMAWASAHQVGPRRRKADVADVGTGKKLSLGSDQKVSKIIENPTQKWPKMWGEMKRQRCFLMIWLIINCLFRSIQSNETKLWWGDWSSNIINGYQRSIQSICIYLLENAKGGTEVMGLFATWFFRSLAEQVLSAVIYRYMPVDFPLWSFCSFSPPCLFIFRR